jgi:hypothetical protein
MKELRSSTVAVALLCVAACADLSGDDRPHRDCFRKAVENAVETKSARPVEPSGRSASAPAQGHAAVKKAATATTPETMNDAGCGCEPEPPEWDGTGRAEAVRGT